MLVGKLAGFLVSLRGICDQSQRKGFDFVFWGVLRRGIFVCHEILPNLLNHRAIFTNWMGAKVTFYRGQSGPRDCVENESFDLQ